MTRKPKNNTLDTKKSFAGIAGFDSYHDYFLHRSKTNPFPSLSLPRLQSHEFTLSYIEHHGLESPLLIEAHAVDFIKFPSHHSIYECFEYLVSAIGSSTSIKVINVAKQQDESMSIEEYKNSFIENSSLKMSSSSSKMTKVLNLISLELSLTSLSTRILGPKAIRQIDWIDQIWPINRRLASDYPRVQKYCLISMSGSYTDFHIDFGGTNVWYHVVKGLKVFYMIRPTIVNLKLYEVWLGSQRQNSRFFGDMIKAGECMEFRLYPGETMVIPSGWIHAVWTLEDSFVFGGNFLSSYTMLKQLQIYCIEHRCNVEDIYRFPYYKQIHCYFIASLYTAIIPDDHHHKHHHDHTHHYLHSGRISYHLQCISSNPKLLRQFICLLKTMELWSRSGGFSAVEDETTFQSILDSFHINRDDFFHNWWHQVMIYANMIYDHHHDMDGMMMHDEDIVSYAKRIRDAVTVNVFDMEEHDDDDDDDVQDNNMDDDINISQDDTMPSSSSQAVDDDGMNIPTQSASMKASSSSSSMEKKAKPIKRKREMMAHDNIDDDMMAYDEDMVDDEDMFIPEPDDDEYEEHDDHHHHTNIVSSTRSSRSLRGENDDELMMLDDDEDNDDDHEDDDDDVVMFDYGDKKKKRKKSLKIKSVDNDKKAVARVAPVHPKPVKPVVNKAPKPKKSTSARDSILKMLAKK